MVITADLDGHPDQVVEALEGDHHPATVVTAGQCDEPLLAQFLGDDFGQLAERLAPVADRVLLRRGQLRIGPLLALTAEDRVIAETALAVALTQDVAELFALDEV